jgi:site-specific recombinase XerD
MSVRPIIWKHKPRKDGTCTIKIYVKPTDGHKYRRTDYHVPLKDWDEKTNRLKKGAPLAIKINAQLESLVHRIRGEHIDGGSSSLIDLVVNFHQECKAGLHALSQDTWRAYPSFKNKLVAFARFKGKQDIRFDDVTVPLYLEFIRWLRGSGVGEHAVATNVKHLKKFMNLGLDLGLHNSEVQRKKAFKSLKPDTEQKIYLTPEEIDTFRKVDLSAQPHLQPEQDRFIISYYFLLRYKDSTQIDEKNFVDKEGVRYYRNKANKTKVTGFIPVKPLVTDILERIDYHIAPTSNQKANDKVKMIAARAGIDEDVNGEPKWSLVTTHTARRSAATNLWLAGVPLPEIMQMGGWKTEHQMKRYLVASGIELAKVSAGRAFFG